MCMHRECISTHCPAIEPRQLDPKEQPPAGEHARARAWSVRVNVVQTPSCGTGRCRTNGPIRATRPRSPAPCACNIGADAATRACAVPHIIER